MPSKPSPTSVVAAAAIAVIAGYLLFRSRNRRHRIPLLKDTRNPSEVQLERQLLNELESPLLTDHSEFVTVRGHRLRIVHLTQSEFNSETPLLVLIHGLGGQLSQWESQIQYFSEKMRVLAVDLLGCGKSQVVTSWDTYTTAALSQDVMAIIDKFSPNGPVVIAGHSYGCAIAATLAASVELRERLRGLVLVSPKESISESQKRGQGWIRWIPDWVIDRARIADRRGGLESKSVKRFLSDDTDDEIKRRQLRWNLMSRTPVYKRFAAGAKLPSPKVYQDISVPVLVIGGSEDKTVPPSDMDIICRHLLADGRQDTLVTGPVIIPGAGHMPIVTHATEINSSINAFVQEQCRID